MTWARATPSSSLYRKTAEQGDASAARGIALELYAQRLRPIGCNGIHYAVIFRYGYCYCKEIEGLHDQPPARTCTKG